MSTIDASSGHVSTSVYRTRSGRICLPKRRFDDNTPLIRPAYVEPPTTVAPDVGHDVEALPTVVFPCNWKDALAASEAIIQLQEQGNSRARKRLRKSEAHQAILRQRLAKAEQRMLTLQYELCQTRTKLSAARRDLEDKLEGVDALALLKDLVHNKIALERELARNIKSDTKKKRRRRSKKKAAWVVEEVVEVNEEDEEVESDDDYEGETSNEEYE